MWILVAEDEQSVAGLIRQGLQEENHSVTLARDGEEALEAVRTCEFDAAVLDVMMPRVNGIEVTRSLRAQGNQLPVLMLTARDAPSDVVKGLDSGADDYLVKPFAFQVLLARLRAIARRAGQPPQQLLQIGGLVLDTISREVSREGRRINLTATEYRVLEYLMRRPGRAASRTAIIEAVWGFEEDIERNTVDAFIKLLRDKVDGPEYPKLIHTVRGFGYILRDGA